MAFVRIGDASSIMICSLVEEALWQALYEAVADRGVAGASVISRTGTEPVSRWLPDAEREPAFLAYSITKTFIATCVLQLVDAAAVHLEDALSRWFTEFDVARRISLRQLMNHTSGIPDYGSLQHYHEAVRSSPSSPWTLDRYARETIGRGLVFEPGKGWLYSNPGYMLLRAVVERVTGQTFSQVLTERILGPLGLAKTFVAETVEDLASLACAPSKLLAPDGSVRDARDHYHPGWVSHGVVASTPSEIALFFDALFAGRLISSEGLRAMTDLVPVPSHLALGSSERPGYGLGLMSDGTSSFGPRWGHDGGGPGYTASARHFAGLGATVCVMAGIEQGFDARAVAWRLLNSLAAQSS